MDYMGAFPIAGLIISVLALVRNVSSAQANGRRLSRESPKIFDNFYRYDSIVHYLTQLESLYPEFVALSTIGVTYEGRSIVGVTISSGGNGSKNAILLESGLHAREWIAPATNLYLIYQLVEHLGANKYLLDNLDWLIVPVSNPDGYEYSHAHDRFWRKNRSPTGSNCKGTDGNRNFGFHWAAGGGSDYPCDEIYQGAIAFSEKESSAIRDFGLANYGRVKVFISLHSYGPFLFYPWGYQWDLPEDWNQLDNLARQVAEAIYRVNGTIYTVGSSPRLFYRAAGGSSDYMKGVQNVAFSYTMELPGGGENGFDPPPSDIVKISAETFEGFKIFGMFAANLN